jgi:hypothetical protein
MRAMAHQRQPDANPFFSIFVLGFLGWIHQGVVADVFKVAAGFAVKNVTIGVPRQVLPFDAQEIPFTNFWRDKGRGFATISGFPFPHHRT